MMPLCLVAMPIGEIFDSIQMAACLSDACPRQTVIIRTDASVLGVGFKIAGNSICIDIIEKSMITSPQLWVMFSLRSQAKSNFQLCQAGYVIKLVTRLYTKSIKEYEAMWFKARIWFELLITKIYSKCNFIPASVTKKNKKNWDLLLFITNETLSWSLQTGSLP